MWKGALFQLSSTDDPKENLETINEMINTAAAKNVDFIALPETANCISNCKTHQDKVLKVEEEDITLASLTKAAKNKALNILVGSLALKLNKSGHKLRRVVSTSSVFLHIFIKPFALYFFNSRTWKNKKTMYIINIISNNILNIYKGLLL